MSKQTSLQMQKNKTRRLIETAVMLALATVLSVLKIAELPYGGSVTFASMLPLAIIAYRYGAGWGLLSGLVYGVIQQLLGLKNLSYFTTWYSIVAIIMLDYLIAFAVIGLCGMFRKLKSQPAGMVLGAVFACIVRYICHVASGATVWAGLSIPTKDAMLYSLVYNATYMIPETLVLLIAAYFISSKLDFRGDQIAPYKAPEGKSVVSNLVWIGGVAIIGAIAFDVVTLFKNLQNAETGKFDITGLGELEVWDWISMAIVTVLAIALAVVVMVLAKKNRQMKNGQNG